MAMFNRRHLLVCTLALCVGWLAAPAMADDSVDEDTIPGEIHISTKHPFVKFQLDGKDWDNHEYSGGNKTLVIRGVSRAEEHTLMLQPRESGWEPETITLPTDGWKRTVVKKGRTRILTFKFTSRVDFKKTPAEPAKP